MKRGILLTAFSVFALLGFASDFGLTLSLAPKYSNSDGFAFSATATPWYSALAGETGSLFLSANLVLKVTEDGTTFEFDARRFQYRTILESGMTLDAGRFAVSDASGLVVSGLMDGVRAELPKDFGTLRFGVWYTGLLNKDTNLLYLSAQDKADMADPDRYFSASRVAASAAYSKRNLFGANSLAAELWGQFDLRGDGDKLHSQYLQAGLSGPISAGLTYRAFLIASLVEKTDEDIAFAGAAALDVTWLPAGELADKVYGEVRWGSGAAEETEGSPFVSLTANPQGNIFDVRLSGLLSARCGYAARLSETLALDASAAAYLRTGYGVNYTGFDASSDFAFLGVEVFGSTRWAPVSDVSVSLGAGAFIPNSGGSFTSDTEVSWLVSAAFLISL